MTEKPERVTVTVGHGIVSGTILDTPDAQRITVLWDDGLTTTMRREDTRPEGQPEQPRVPNGALSVKITAALEAGILDQLPESALVYRTADARPRIAGIYLDTLGAYMARVLLADDEQATLARVFAVKMSKNPAQEAEIFSKPRGDGLRRLLADVDAEEDSTTCAPANSRWSAAKGRWVPFTAEIVEAEPIDAAGNWVTSARAYIESPAASAAEAIAEGSRTNRGADTSKTQENPGDDATAPASASCRWCGKPIERVTISTGSFWRHSADRLAVCSHHPRRGWHNAEPTPEPRRCRWCRQPITREQTSTGWYWFHADRAVMCDPQQPGRDGEPAYATPERDALRVRCRWCLHPITRLGTSMNRWWVHDEPGAPVLCAYTAIVGPDRMTMRRAEPEL